MTDLLLDAYRVSTPRDVSVGARHMPLILPDERSLDAAALRKLRVARSVGVRYLTLHNVHAFAGDLELHERLLSGGGANGHWSPTEHVAAPLDDPREMSAAENAATFPDEIARTG